MHTSRLDNNYEMQHVRKKGDATFEIVSSSGDSPVRSRCRRPLNCATTSRLLISGQALSPSHVSRPG